MSWRDRPYASDDYSRPELRVQFRRPSTAVTWLIIANVVVFFLDLVSQNFAGSAAHRLFGLSLGGLNHLFLWQPLTYMFMHDGILHLLFNMIGLYVFGSEFERAFGRDRFLQFYATCGLVGGLAYLCLPVFNAWYHHTPVALTIHYGRPLIGASGAIYGLLIAAIIFFPHIQIILFIFPMPIRVFGLIVGAILVLQLISPGRIENLGGEICHVAGATTGIVIFHAWGIMPRIRFGGGQASAKIPFGRKRPRRRSEGAWVRKQKKLAEEQAEVDRILAKVHQQGLQSLTRSERKLLARATRRQQERERQLGRTDRL